MGQRLEQYGRLEGQRLKQSATDIGKAVADIALALRAYRHVDRQHQGIEPGVRGAAYHVLADLSLVRRIKLIPGIGRRDLGRRLDRGVAGARHDVRDVRFCRGLRQHKIGAAAEKARPAGRCNAERARVGPAEQARRLIALRDVDQIARQK
jgi:hypothetical protein